MCGIAGFWNKDKKEACREILESMNSRLISRGPDASGIWSDHGVGFAHRRLSILDLTPQGNQPMTDPETGNVIVYNGEVYNFKEIAAELDSLGVSVQSRSDTEIVLKSYRVWGEECLGKFTGMFSFVIWDNKKHALFAARDRLGIKPLYYMNDDRSFMFASRLKALLAHPECPRDIDHTAVGLYIECGYVPAPLSILQSVKKLKPGCYLRVDAQGITEECYWAVDTLSIDDSLSTADENEIADRFDSLLQTAVKDRLVSDVPLGAFLSGGIDSSAVVASMASTMQTSPKTFTVDFEENTYSEGAYAVKIAEILGTDHNQHIMHSRDMLPLIDRHSHEYDEPFADYSSLPTMLLSQFARDTVTVCLSGDGGDELFAGYHYYTLLSYFDALYKVPEGLRWLLAKGIRMFRTHKARLFANGLLQKKSLSAFSFMRTFLKDFGFYRLLDESHTPRFETMLENRSGGFPEMDSISKACRLDICYYLADDILQKVDVASMSVGLEARVPILDHRIVEFSQSLPVRFKKRGSVSKWLLRRVLKRYLPEEMFNRPKSGFEVPLRQWFRNDLKDMIQDELSESRVKKTGFLKYDGVKYLLDLHISGKRDTHPLLWSLLALMRWCHNLNHVW